MPAFPTIDAPSVQEAGLPGPNVQLDARGAYGEAQAGALHSLGQDIGEAVGTGAELYAKAWEKAAAARATDADNKIIEAKNAKFDTPGTGLKFQTGEAAFAASKGAMEDLAKQRDEIAKTMLRTEEERRLFRLRTNGHLEQWSDELNQHLGHQFEVVRAGNVDANEKLNLAAVHDNYADDKSAARTALAHETIIRANQLSTEMGDAQVAEWNKKVAKARLDEAIATKDYRTAQRLFEGVPSAPASDESPAQPFTSGLKAQLGEARDDYEAKIAVLRGKVVGRATADQLMALSTDTGSGLYDPVKLQALEKKVAPEDKQYVFAALEPIRAQAKEANKAIINGYWENALRAYEQRHAISDVATEDEQWLKKYAIADWRKLDEMARADTIHAKTAAAGDPTKVQAYIAAMKDLNDRKDYWVTQDPAEWNRVWGSQLTAKDRKSAGLDFAKARADKAAKPDKLVLLPKPTAAVVQDLFDKRLGKPKDMSKWDPETLDLWTQVHDHVERQWSQSKPEDRTEENAMGWAKEKLMDVVVVGGGRVYGDTTTTRVQAEANARFKGKTLTTTGGAPLPPLSGADRAPAKAPGRTVVRKQQNRAIGKTRITYSDGAVEELDGLQ